mgnify:CR=1 FL=1
MKISQYNWNWWFVLSTISLIALAECSTFLLVQIPEKQETIIQLSWILWTIQFIVCLYIGMKPEESNKKI